MRMSKSKVNLYKQCPRKFDFTYVKELPKLEPEDPDHPLIIGTDVHNIFENFLKDNDEEWLKSISYDDRLSLIKEYDPDEKYTTHLENFINFLDLIFTSGYTIVGCEPHFESPALNLHGYLDLVLESNDKLVVIDYKTGKTKAITDYQLELVYYALLAQKELGKDVSMVGVFFSKEGNLKLANFLEEPVKGAWLSYEDVKTAVAYLRHVEEKIENEEFKFKRSWLCNHCEFADECKELGYDEYGLWG